MSAPVITEPGVYDIPDEVYHADPVPADRGHSLSASGARKLLPPSCPAKFKWDRDHPPESKPHFDFGKAAHKLVLGNGPEIAVIEADDWRAAKAQSARKDAYAADKVPMLTAEYAQARAMAAAIREHPLASALFDPERGQPERSFFWEDAESGVWRRGRLDWLPNPIEGRLIVPDYKTAVSAFPASFGKSAADYGYAMQRDWYETAVIETGLAEETAFVFVVQEKFAPYVVTVLELGPRAKRIGAGLNRRAIDIYAECQSIDTWPAYSDEVEMVELPRWFEIQNEEFL